MSLKNLLCVTVMSIIAAGCAANLNVDQKVIAVVGDKKITYGEFERQYAENSLPQEDSAKSFDSKSKFLNLLVDYNLKLLEAQKEGLADDPAVKQEMNDYEGQLAVSYIMEHEITDPMVKQIYERQKYEVRADQVFIPFTPGPGDTLKAYTDAKEAIAQLDSGVSIDTLEHKYKGGDTYFITAGSYLQYKGGKEFENMLYSLVPGQVSPTPIRTAFGYLVIKLTDKRPRVDSVRASHILIAISGKSPEDTLTAYDKAIAILDSIKQGVDFAKLAEDNSIDKFSAARGGDLGYFARGMMVRPFDEAVFNMKVGEVAGPIRTRFGYHIIKLTGIKPLPTFAEAKARIRSYYLSSGYKSDLADFVEQLKQNFGFKDNDQTFAMLHSKVDTTKQFEETDFDSLLTPAELQEPLFTFDNMPWSIDTVISVAKTDAQLGPLLMTSSDIHSIAEDAAKQLVLTHYSMEKARTYPEFDSLIGQYENGILIYHLEQRKVWDRLQASDSVLKPYYFDHVDKYYWPKRVDLSEIHVATDTLADSIYTALQGGADFDSLAAKYSKPSGSEAKDGHWGVFVDSTNALVIGAFSMKPGEIGRPTRYEDKYWVIKVNRFVDPEPKTFEEAKGEVSSDYQETESKKIQNDWMENLKKEFGVKIDEKVFRELAAR